MRKATAHVCLTYYDDSRTVSWSVVHVTDGEPWELFDEGSSMPSRGALDAFDAFKRWLELTMAGLSSSTSSTSEVG